MQQEVQTLVARVLMWLVRLQYGVFFKRKPKLNVKKGAQSTPDIPTGRDSPKVDEKSPEIENMNKESDDEDDPSKRKLTAMKRIFLFSDELANIGITDDDSISKAVDRIRHDGVLVSAFGIGTAFSEVLMRRIANVGRGSYFFIESPAQIPMIVNKALTHLLALIGSDAQLKLTPSKTTSLIAIHGHKDPSTAKIGDLHEGTEAEDEITQILAEIEVDPQSDEARAEVLNFELSYKPCDMDERVTIPGSLALNFIENPDEVKNNEINEVKIALRMTEINALDKKVVNMIDNNKIKEAITLKEEAINGLAQIETLDKSGIATKLLQYEKSALKSLREQKDLQLVRKQNDYVDYLAEMKNSSMFYIDEFSSSWVSSSNRL